MNWIKCSEQMPESWMDILFVNGIVRTGYYMDDNSFMDVRFKEISDAEFVTYWMPYPEPPK